MKLPSDRDRYKLNMEPTKPETLEDAQDLLLILVEAKWISKKDYRLFVDMLGLEKEDSKTLDPLMTMFSD